MIPVTENCTAVSIETGEQVKIGKGAMVTFLYKAADQDGFDGEHVVRLSNKQEVAINPQFLGHPEIL